MNLTTTDAAAVLSAADDILILTHRRPDGDALGSAAGLCRALRATGKRAYVFENEDITPRYAPMVADLFPPAGYAPGFVMAVDTADFALLTPSERVYEGRIELLIDHHRTSKPYAERLCVDAGAAACGELIYAVIRALGAPIDVDTADALYTAISTDTGCFKYGSTTAQTLRIAGDLLEAGAHAEDINYSLFIARPKTRIALERAVLESLRYFGADGQVAGVAITREVIAETGATEDDLDGISALPRQIEGVEVGITAIERADGCKMSVRTGKYLDASALCHSFGGGGHRQAAGCSIDAPPYEAVRILCEAALRALPARADTEADR